MKVVFVLQITQLNVRKYSDVFVFINESVSYLTPSLRPQTE